MEWFQEKGKFLLNSGLLLLLGILVLWQPGLIFNGIIYLIAAYFAIMGILNLYTVLREKPNVASSYASGILLLIVALAIIVLAKPILSLIPFFLGILVILAGIRQLRQELALQQENQGRLTWLIFSLVLIIAGVILVFNPFRSILLLFQFFGGVLVIYGLSQLLFSFRTR